MYILSLDSKDPPRRLTSANGHDAHPDYSPDGKWLVFTSERGGMNDEEPLIKSVIFSPQAYGDIYAVRIDDGYVVRLTENKWGDDIPTWGAGE
ncbi:MAG: hypothetical protein C5B54_04775 [Acidobacteria bacterium]|nr:MAG: hypothetical protein C5B54_04775 [Acidobacteriota bacterium]